MWLHGLIAPGEYIITNVFFFENHHTFFLHAQLLFGPKPFFKTFQWSKYYSKVFEKYFRNFSLSVPILEFLAPLEVFQGLCC
jgi:hypothetical protein